MTSHSIIFLGATGAVGRETLNELLKTNRTSQVTLLGRRVIPNLDPKVVQQHQINIFEPTSYSSIITQHDLAICTLGVGEPSKVSKEEFIKIDKTAVINFAKKCKEAGIKHFQLLASVSINPKSSNYYLRTKGELVEGLKALKFERLSIFMPSMILTPTNRYGFSQALTLAIWPLLKPLLLGPLRKFRGIKVEDLGKAIALNSFTDKGGYEELVWDDFKKISQ